MSLRSATKRCTRCDRYQKVMSQRAVCNPCLYLAQLKQPAVVAKKRAKTGVRSGESHHATKLTEAQVHSIRAKHAEGRTYASLAREYEGLASTYTVRQIVMRKTWKHI